VLALAGANAVGVVLFGTLYALAGARVLSQLAFLACLVVVFGLVTVLWVRTEARHRTLDPLRRLGRIVIGLLVVVIGTPAAVLTPLFWLDQQLPPEVGLNATQGGIMALVFITLMLVVVVNVVGAVVALARTTLARA
jgi:hypothetical protein